MNRIQTSTLTIALVAGLLVASGLLAYTLLSPQRTWPSAPTFIVDEHGSASVNAPDGGVSAVVDAINSTDGWNGGGAGTVVGAEAGDTSGFQPGDGIPMLLFDDPLGVCTGNCIVVTFTGFYQQGDDGYEITDADILTNDSHDFTIVNETGGCSNEIHLESLYVHEIGHGLGLGHSSVSGATMYPALASCDNGAATIEQDDADGLQALYGCILGGTGASCTSDDDCCSGDCRGRWWMKTCH